MGLRKNKKYRIVEAILIDIFRELIMRICPRLVFLFIFAVCLVFLPRSVQAQEMDAARNAAKNYYAELVQEHHTTRDTATIRQDISAELSRIKGKKNYNHSRLIDYGYELIANEKTPSVKDWLLLMDAPHYGWQRGKAQSYLPGAPYFWEPSKNTLVLIGFNALAAAKTTSEGDKVYRELLDYLKEVNDHPQAGKGGYKLFALEAEIAGVVAERDDIVLRALAKERQKALDVLLTQKLLDHEQKKESDVAQLCLQFRLPLPARGVTYEDYIRVSPSAKITAIPLGEDKLCLRGMSYAADYTVRILKGLPTSLAIGKNMTADDKLTVNFGDRDPVVRMSSGKYILSRDVVSGIPVETVNLDKVKLRVAKALTERALPHDVNTLDRELYSYKFDQYFRIDGEPVWEGEMDIASIPNKAVTTYFPVQDVLKNPAPGVYAVEAEYRKDNRRIADARQFFVVTDIGLTTLTAENGFYIFARSLKTAKPLAGAAVKLISRNNTVLGKGVTDQDGKFRFDGALAKGKAGLEPLLATAVQGNDFALIRLDVSAYDFSDRGVSGRSYPGPVDAFVYTDRGVYRPGEDVQLSLVMRDDNGYALPDLPVTVKFFRPDGIEHLQKTFAKTTLGGATLSLPLPPNARMGMWSVSTYVDPSGAAVGTASFRVEEYVPPRISVELTAKDDVFMQGKSYELPLQSDYLYGAPAAGLKIAAEAVLLKDDTPFPQFKDYSFGLVQDDYKPKRYTLAAAETDEKGAATVTAEISDAALADVNAPLKARIRASVFEKGGRAVSAVIDRPFRHRPVYLGIREVKDGGGYNAPKKFEVIALNTLGERVALDGVEYRLVRENYYYNWYNASGGWRYRRQYFDEEQERNIIAVSADKPQIIKTQPLNGWWGHRLEILHSKTGTAASIRLQGYWGDREEDTPDTVAVAAKTGTAKTGTETEIAIKPPYAGEAIITVVNNKVLFTKNVTIEEKGATVSVPVTEDWGAGAYVLVSLVRPTPDAAGQHDGTRAIGLAWIAADRADKKLDVSFGIPEKILPRQRFALPVFVKGLDKGEEAYITISAVDEGVLRLTDFKTPDPFKFYFGQRRLGAMLHDIYGKLLKGAEGGVGKIRSGGDGRERSEADDAFRPETYIKTAALFSGIVKLGADGKADIDLDIPDFNGQLRLMAVAWSGQKTGNGEDQLIVRDPVIVQATLPRFLAPEDKTTFNLRLHNLDGAAGEYRLTLRSKGVTFEDTALTRLFNLAAGEEKTMALPLTALPETGIAAVTLELSGPEQFSVKKDWRFSVRPYQILRTNDLLAKVGPEGTWRAPDLTKDYWPGTITASAVMAPRNMLNMTALVDSLQRYPYGCTEQLVSSSLPLLHMDELHKKWDLRWRDDADLLRLRAAASVARVINNMRGDGSFGYWTAHDDSNLWLSAYATEYLMEAHENGLNVPASVLERALSYLTRKTQNPDNTPEGLSAASYAFYVLAKAGKSDAGQLRYFYDQNAEKLQPNWSLAMIGGALARYGETSRAKAAFEKALTRVEEERKSHHYWYYGSRLRNKAVLLALAAEYPDLSLKTDDLFDKLVAAYDKQTYFSTQEQIWLTRAAMRMPAEKSQKISFTFAPPLQMVETEKPHNVKIAENASRIDAFEMTNMGDSNIYLRLSLLAAPRATLPEEEQGFKVTRRYYNMDGSLALEDGKVAKNTLLVAVIDGQLGQYQNRSGENLLVDMLPAGFELENAELAGGTGTDELGWLLKNDNLTELAHKELRDDRYVASFRRGSGQEFHAAYLVRAVTPGVYAHPAVYVEDMYHPGLYGRGAAATVTITDE